MAFPLMLSNQDSTISHTSSYQDLDINSLMLRLLPYEESVALLFLLLRFHTIRYSSKIQTVCGWLQCEQQAQERRRVRQQNNTFELDINYLLSMQYINLNINVTQDLYLKPFCFYFHKPKDIFIEQLILHSIIYQSSMSEAIKVVVRIRPMNQKQKDRGCTSVVKVDQQNNQISIYKPDEVENTKAFAFDNVFGEDSHQQTVYTKTAYNLVQNVLTGYNGTIFAYGQTGCGKTHSMVGKVEDEDLQGIIPRSFGHILKSISQTKQKQFLIRCSFIEIYNEEVRDLLAKDVKNKLEVKQSTEKGVFIKDLSINVAKKHEQLMEYMNMGNKNRSVGQTAMNKDSSRSHLLFCLYLQSAQLTTGEERKYVASKLNLVDLAGSQRISKTGVSGDRLKEAQKINLSLSALGNVISALVDGKSQHIPYRDSKLTRLLQDSLGGNTKTIMIANCSPADYNFDETLSTLRYASRAKFIKNKPIINEDPKDALLKQYANQIKNLKRLIAQQNGSIDPNELKSLKDQSHQQFHQKLKEKQQELNQEKEEKRKLLERIKQLQSLHVEAKDIHMNNHLVENINKAKIEAQEYKNNSKQRNPNYDPLEEEVRQIEQQSTSQTNAAGNEVYSEKYKNVVKKLKSKVKSLEQDLKDIQHENFQDKQQNLEDIRVLSKQNKLLEGIISILVQSEQLDAIKSQCIYNQDNDEYKIPPFYFKGKQLVFPKLPQNQSMDMIRQMQQNRYLNFEQKSMNINSSKDALRQENGKSSPNKPLNVLSSNEYCVKDIIKEARTEKVPTVQQKQQKKLNRKIQLEPIRKQI